MIMILQKIRSYTLAYLPYIVVASVVASIVVSGSAGAAVSEVQDGVDSISAGGAADTSLTDIIRIIINTILFLVGAVAVIMIIIGGFRYVVAQGDTGQLTLAKNTILYAVIGLVVAIAAFAIVNFVLDAFV